jgi:hypothetical protein
MNYLSYIDPGSGSYLVQIVIAGALGILFFFKNIGRFFVNIWLHIKSFFSRSPKKQNEN